MTKLPNLRKRIIIGLLIYTTALTFAVGLHGFLVNEHIEELVWENILNIDLNVDHPLENKGVDSNFKIYDERYETIPTELEQYKAGIHDEILFHNKIYVIKVIQHDSYKQILALDITEVEYQEFYVVIFTVFLTILAILLMMWIAYYQLGKLINPLLHLANELSRLAPVDGKIQLDQKQIQYYESSLLTEAIQTYIEKSQNYLEKEKIFFSTVSHELRTPITIISGVIEIMRHHKDTSDTLAPHLDRANRVAHEMEDLIACLLFLARDKEGLDKYLEDVDLYTEIPAIIESHLVLCEGKQLKIENLISESFIIRAPLQLIKVTIGNLLRNAIENSDQGVIRISREQNVLKIDDPGHGMTAIELSQYYTVKAKQGMNKSGGIGIPLILKICDHFGWHLRIETKSGQGTIVVLSF